MLELRKRADKSGDPIKTVYRLGDQDIPKAKADEINALAEQVGVEAPPVREVSVWPLAGVELVGEAPQDHGFADTFVARALTEGYASFEDMTLHTTEGYERNPVVTGSTFVLDLTTGPLRYTVVEAPGKYADEDEPSGFRISNEYRCQLES